MSSLPIGVSNRHLHLSQEDAYKLRGNGYELKKMKDLSQPGQFACEETVDLVGPKGTISKVRVLGPYRKQTQVEILLSDGFKLGVSAPIRISGDLENTPGIQISSNGKTVEIDSGLIVAQRHLHISPKQAEELGLQNGQIIKVKLGRVRKAILDNVIVRTDGELDLHLDLDEANGCGVLNGETAEIYKRIITA